MIVISANNIRKEYGTDIILKDISFHINEGDRVGLIGANGAGKTTLMKILTGELSHEGGEYFISQNLSIGYLKQHNSFESKNTVIQEIDGIFAEIHRLEDEIHRLSEEIAEASERGEDVEKRLHILEELQRQFENKNGYGYKSEITGILTSMAFTEEFYDKKIETLSGGEKTRLALAALLLKKPDILFLDEPTNHLDIGTLKWLEQYLKTYKGTIFVVSHDRYFLDNTVNKIFEIENKKLYVYEGTYATFAEKKRQRREEEWRKYNAQQRDIAKQEEIIRRFKGHGTEKLAKRAASRERMLEHMERIERPEAQLGKMKIHFKENYKSGQDVLLGENISKGFGYGHNRRELFKNVNFDIKRGERVCIVGANGIGKTTLLKILTGELEADSGYLKKGVNVDIGYYDQGQMLLNGENTVLEELKESYRLYSDTEMRSILGRFLFKNDQVFLKINSLSGGEKARLSLAKMILAGTNVLILDEPTNHLDIESKEVFEDALSDYTGTVIVVSHDRYFLKKVPHRILELTEDGMINYLGAYDYYMEKKQEVASGKSYLKEMSDRLSKTSNQSYDKAQKSSEDSVSTFSYNSFNKILPQGNSNLSRKGSMDDISEETDSAKYRRLQKEKDALERRQKREREKLEAEIQQLEEEIAEKESEMCKPENHANHKLLTELSESVIKLKQDLDEKYDSWLELQE